MGLFTTISKELRESEDSLSNEYVYQSMTLARKRESKRIEGEKHKNRLAAYVPAPWSHLGKGSEQGNVILAGKHLEIWMPFQSYNVGEGVEGQKQPVDSLPETEESIARRVNARARKQIRRIVNANEFQGMATLTLAPPSVTNDAKYDTIDIDKQRDYATVRRLFKVFIQRLCRALKVSSIPYLVVFELHDSMKTSDLKRNTWHLHLATSTENALRQGIKKTWTHGLVDFQDFRYDKKGQRREKDISNPGAYMAEYIGKEGAQFGDAKLRNKKRYTVSRSAKRPKKEALSTSGIRGDLQNVSYGGKEYSCTYYRANTLPGSVLASHTAHYVQIGE